MKIQKKKIHIFLILFIVCLGCAVSFILNKKDKSSSIDNVKGNLIISTFSEHGKGEILLYDLENNKEISLIDSNVAITGDLSEDGSKLTYVNALDNYDPWQVYIHNIGKNKDADEKLTDNEDGKTSPIFKDNNLVYYITGGDSGSVQIAKEDIYSKESSLIDDKTSDCIVDAMDIRNQKIIMCITSNNLYSQAWENSDGRDIPIKHSICETNQDGENLKKIVDIQASEVNSISYTPSGDDLIIGGCDINGDSGKGIYRISLSDGNVTTILNEKMLSEDNLSEVREFSNPNLAKMSADEECIFFSGVASDAESSEIEGIKCYSTAIFSYNINNKQIKKVYEPKETSFIFGLNIKY